MPIFCGCEVTILEKERDLGCFFFLPIAIPRAASSGDDRIGIEFGRDLKFSF